MRSPLAWLRRHPRAVFPLALAVVALAVLSQLGARVSAPSVRYTVAELEVVHREVRVGARAIEQRARLSIGDRIDTGEAGRARVRLDDGTTLVVDRATRLALTQQGVLLEAGRIFAEGGAAARSEIDVAGATTVVSASSIAFERQASGARIYCASGEAHVRAGARQERVRTGETATVAGTDVKVAPEAAFNDWTGGLANPWGADAPRRAIGELWGKSSDGADDGGAELAIRSHEIDARIEGEVAVTRTETTYFNGGSATLVGEFRVQLPPDALVSRFAVRRGERLEEGAVREANEKGASIGPRLEWAGNGWVRGQVPGIRAGDAVGVVLEWVEWLSPANGRLTYRYPMRARGGPSLIGELLARIDVRGAPARSISVGAGATIDGGVVELRKADVRPDADLVVELEAPAGLRDDDVRAYLVKAPEGDVSPDPYVLLRADLSARAAPDGVALAIIVDTSWSAGPAGLDAGRGVVDALLEALGPNDRAVVLRGDWVTHAVGPEHAGPVDEARRKAIHDALLAIDAGGATDLDAAIARAADELPADATAGMVVYVGDGWPTLGETDMAALRRRLEARVKGAPRFAAVAIGPHANRYGLVTVAHGSGPVLEVTDRVDAARAAEALLTTALAPSVEGFELDLGATIDRVYPRGALVAPAGSSVMLVGRARGELPKSVLLRYRRAGALVEERRPVSRLHAAESADVRRRWALARISELSLAGEGLEAGVELAVRTGLLTPWTAWGTGDPPPTTLQATPFGSRGLDLDGIADAPFAARLAPVAPSAGALLEPPSSNPGSRGDDLGALVAAGARRAIDDAIGGIRKCRDLRAVVRPDIAGALRVRVKIDGDGRAVDVVVRADRQRDDDPALDRCVKAVVASLSYFDSGETGTTLVDYEVKLAPPRDVRRTRCSRASTLPLPLRRVSWRARLDSAPATSAVATFITAKRACEFASWSEQRAFLEVLLERVQTSVERVGLARVFDETGESDAATFVRRAALRDAQTVAELTAVRTALIGDEPSPGKAFERQYAAARTDAARLAVVRRHLRVSPHDPTLRRRLFALLESTGANDALVAAIRVAREDPFADAGLLADGASALRRLGRDEEGRRAFGELVERAPRDPFARAYLGDRLRDEGLFDDATAAYEALATLLPGDPAASMRLALAHAGAGRLDVATRILDRVAQTGGRGDDTKLGELASVTTAVLLAAAREHAGPDAARLERRGLDVPLPDVAGFVLVRAPVLDDPLKALITRLTPATERNAKDGGELPDLMSPSMGLYAARIDRNDRGLVVKLARSAGAARPIKIGVDLVSWGDDRRVRKFAHKEVELRPSDAKAEVHWDGESLL